jgi:hypothetical protein
MDARNPVVGMMGEEEINRGIWLCGVFIRKRSRVYKV